MFRGLALLIGVIGAIDWIVTGGRYVDTCMRIGTSILHHFGH